MKTYEPSLDLYQEVLAGFVRQRTSLAAWCRANGTHPSNVNRCLVGAWNGPRAKALRARVCAAAFTAPVRRAA